MRGVHQSGYIQLMLNLDGLGLNMQIRITTNAREVRDKFARLNDNLPKAMDNSANAIVDGFVLSLKAAAPRWTGRLQESIRAEKLKDGEYVVKMIKYGIVADSGRSAGFTPSATLKGYTKLQLWAASKGIPYWALKNWIRFHGTRPASVHNDGVGFIAHAISDLEYSMVLRDVIDEQMENAIISSGIGR